jgi:hypothetical protein
MFTLNLFNYLNSICAYKRAWHLLSTMTRTGTRVFGEVDFLKIVCQPHASI